MGRPSKLTKERTTRIIEAMRVGSFRDRAAKLAGIGRSTLYDWLGQGEQDLKAGKKTVASQFKLDFEEAEAESEYRKLKVIDDAATRKESPDWKAAAWMLERKWPDRWARRQVISLSRDDGIVTTTMIELANLSTDELRQMRDLVGKAAKKQPATETKPEPKDPRLH